MYQLLNNWIECPKMGKKRKAPKKPLLKVWKIKSIFWGLPHWSVLNMPHYIYVMHITKNVYESLLGTLFNMTEYTNDGLRARQDLEYIGIRVELHVGATECKLSCWAPHCTTSFRLVRN